MGSCNFRCTYQWKKKQLAPCESLIISLFSFTQFSRFPVVALASQSSQVLLFFGNYLISPLSVCYEYIFHLLSILFMLFFLVFLYKLPPALSTEPQLFPSPFRNSLLLIQPDQAIQETDLLITYLFIP